MKRSEKKFINPYLAGVLLGLVLLGGFLISGHGLGASGGVYRIGVSIFEVLAPAHVGSNAYMSSAVSEGSPLTNFYVFMVLGVFLGGLVSSFAAGRMALRVGRGPRISVSNRLALAFLGGSIMGFAARLGRGCTSSQAMSGGALLSVGSWAFMLSIFAGGYALAYFFRRQWT
ncbi:MAG: YeeE/YedE family protein [Proteobacteria bacterium]|jgi:uncharacterized protein|nr:YeeE/YedE family protein [Pseudomonadota bacterium]